MAPVGKVGVIGAGSAAWRKVIADPLKRRMTGGSGHFDDNGDLASDSINTIIEGEIIPRLLVAHCATENLHPPVRNDEIDHAEAMRFAALPLELEAAALLEEVDSYLEQGISVETVYLDLLAPAARRLGEMWEQDECDFIDVTMGLWRLQEVMRDIAARSPPIVDALNAPRSALFCPVPGDQHSFGSIMIEDVFARAGWNSEVIPRPERRELLDAVAKRPFDLLGLTLSRDCTSAAVSKLVVAVRSVSLNPHISVLVGGRMVNQNPAMVAEVGADGTGVDARAALEVAERLVLAAPALAQPMR
ncbi:B12-binding domain-containing protein [Erythrobacter sp. JK5]|uniref:cobalamin B12-binding domain-containing protein n=1 Tax=Erythrobacter sp. JK5 TaxID=2829500 RepID=UPI001BAAE2D3|nr:cobalamin-dependent protein [Erythrobacter sp. JK5]QUL38030.1 cobalamin-dependent protein [Erythrobacter sp. JK5]